MGTGKRAVVFFLIFMLSGGAFAMADSAVVCPTMAAGIVQPEPVCCGEACECEFQDASTANFSAILNAVSSAPSFDFLKDKPASAGPHAVKQHAASEDFIPPKPLSRAKLYDLDSEYRI
jgi:hypothetical protein